MAKGTQWITEGTQSGTKGPRERIREPASLGTQSDFNKGTQCKATVQRNASRGRRNTANVLGTQP